MVYWNLKHIRWTVHYLLHIHDIMCRFTITIKLDVHFPLVTTNNFSRTLFKLFNDLHKLVHGHYVQPPFVLFHFNNRNLSSTRWVRLSCERKVWADDSVLTGACGHWKTKRWCGRFLEYKGKKSMSFFYYFCFFNMCCIDKQLKNYGTLAISSNKWKYI